MKYIKYGSGAVIIAALLWSLDGVLRRNLYSLPPSVVVFWEHIFGLALITPIILSSLKAFKKLTRKQWVAITGVSFLSGALGTILYTAALGKIQYIPFSVVVLLQLLNPIFAVITAGLLLHEPLTKKFFGLAAVAMVGAYIVSFPGFTVNFSTGNGTLVAALFALGAAACWGTSTAFSKYALKDTSSLHITAARFGITPIFALMFVVLSGSTGSLTALTGTQLKYIVAITFSAGLVAMAIYYFGLKRIPASRSEMLELAWPLSAVFVGYAFLEQSLTLTQIVGALILAGAIYLIARDAQEVATSKLSKPLNSSKAVAK
ncbi:MAG: DMT family transporter [Patescibacteria group bacterium]